MVDAEVRLGPRHGEPLDRVDELLALVVAPARVPFRVLVGQYRARGLKDRNRGVVLRRDQPDLLELPPGLALDQPGDLRVCACDMRDGRLMHGGLLGHDGTQGTAGARGGLGSRPRRVAALIMPNGTCGV